MIFARLFPEQVKKTEKKIKIAASLLDVYVILLIILIFILFISSFSQYKINCKKIYLYGQKF